MVSSSVPGVGPWPPSFPQRAQELVYDLVKDRLEPTDHHVSFALADVYVVTFSYVLIGWKAFVSTTLPDGMYYEVTHDSTKKVTYISSYKQWEHKTIPDEVTT